jgi:ADP-ribose pyrophosphatase YjhB (NUDIX family)
MLSEIQSKILALISRSDGLRYSKAYPGGEIDDDLYNYHLQELVKKDLLRKENGVYTLTDAGKMTILPMDSRGEWQDMFRMAVILVVTRNSGEEILVHKRIRHPYKGEISTISGKIHAGEKYVDAAKRKLNEEAGLTANFEYWSSFRSIRKTNIGKLVEDTIYTVCVARDPTGEMVEINQFGENWWETYDKIFDYMKNNLATGNLEIELLKEIKSGVKTGRLTAEEEIVLNRL